MVHVIFLDIDGVICCNMSGRLEEAKLNELKGVVQATSAKVVLSTDWRRQAQLKRQVVAALKRLDIEVIGATPCRAMYQPIRPQEITEWMSKNAADVGVEGWVAIDDRDLLNEHGGQGLVGHMVRTHPNSGLTKRLADVCIHILNAGPAGSSGTNAMAATAPITMAGAASKAGFSAAATMPARTAARSTSPNGSPLRQRGSAMTGAAAAPSSLLEVKAMQGEGAASPYGAKLAGRVSGASPATPATRRVAEALTPGGKQGAGSSPASKRWGDTPFVLPSD